MQGLVEELRRLGRHVARDRGGRRAARVHLWVLGAAILLAFFSRAVRPLPLLGWLEEHWIWACVASVGLYLLARPLHLLFTRVIRPDLRELASELDDDHGWRDDTTTAVELPEAHSGVSQVLVAQTTGRLRHLDSDGVRTVGRFGRRLRMALCLLFLFVLLGPGVDGLLGERGAGRGTDAGLGQSPEDAGGGPPPPLEADWFLATFVEDPIPAEALPPEPAPPADEEPGK